eukprot:snap_masked-scaffold_2-processed-gene-22.2-mRNA-1 protein AED:1.00 eAED:1.00 QI:0/0/0/0/1/1/3/0/355
MFGSTSNTNPPSLQNSGTFASKITSSFSCCGCFSIEFYQPYFDFSSNEILDRLLSSVFIIYKPTLISTFRTTSADLYTSLWIPTTLALLISVYSNLNKLLSSLSFSFSEDVKEEEKDLKKADAASLMADPVILSYALTTVFTFSCGLPLVHYALANYFFSSTKEKEPSLDEVDDKDLFKDTVLNTDEDGNEKIEYLRSLKLVEIISLYQYSFMSYIVFGLLCILPNEGFEWLGLLIAFIFASTFLIINFEDIPNAKNLEESKEFKFQIEDKELDYELDQLKVDSLEEEISESMKQKILFFLRNKQRQELFSPRVIKTYWPFFIENVLFSNPVTISDLISSGVPEKLNQKKIHLFE